MMYLKIVCWAYLIYNILGRIVNYEKKDIRSMIIRIIDDATIFGLIFAIYLLTKST